MKSKFSQAIIIVSHCIYYKDPTGMGHLENEGTKAYGRKEMPIQLKLKLLKQFCMCVAVLKRDHKRGNNIYSVMGIWPYLRSTLSKWAII